MRAPLLILSVALFVAAQAAGWARAGAPYDIVVTALESVEPALRQARFDFVTRELAMTIAAPPNFAVAAMGVLEGELSFDNRVAFVHSAPAPGEGSSAWQDLTESGEPDQVAFVPTLTLRKGLPYSFEVAGRIGWYAGSRQFIVGGFGRWVPFGNWEKVPDVSLSLGYTGLVGNDQLEMGVFQLDLSVGYTFLMNRRATRPGTRFSPFGGYSFLQSHARPGVTVDALSPVTGWAGLAVPGVDPRASRYHRGFVGMEVRAGSVSFRVGANATFPRRSAVLAGVDVSLGLRF